MHHLHLYQEFITLRMSMKETLLPHLEKVKTSSASHPVLHFILEIALLLLQVEKHVSTCSVDVYSLRDSPYHEIP